GETFCRTLQHTLTLAAPGEADFGALWTAGRFHLATRPTFCRLADRSGQEVQFVLMPYPTPERYLDDALPRHETRDRLLLNGFRDTWRRYAHSRFRPGSIRSWRPTCTCPRSPSRAAMWSAKETESSARPTTSAGAGRMSPRPRPQAANPRRYEQRYCGSIDRPG
ncbi:MAG: hypothetical protein WKF75_11725, partial [Singulisphaera sp.]